MPRRELVSTRLKKAINKKSPSDFLWGLLELAYREIDDGKLETFTGTDLKGFIQILVSELKNDVKGPGKDDQLKLDELEAYLSGE